MVGYEISSWKWTGHPIGIYVIAEMDEKTLFQRPLGYNAHPVEWQVFLLQLSQPFYAGLLLADKTIPINPGDKWITSGRPGEESISCSMARKPVVFSATP